jgi:peptidoglycan pentaglycine glycine transferase (the first glycine)
MNSETWNNNIASFPDAHLLQTWQWGLVKSQYGWKPIFQIWGAETKPDAAALILQREIPIAGFAARLSVMYVPKGPLLRDWADKDLRERVVADLQQLARQRRAIFIKMDPDIPTGRGVPGEEDAEEDPLGERIRQEWLAKGWRYSDEQIQFRNTFLVDLRASEEELLARMKQKTRYNIRYAGRKGVIVREGDPADFDLLYRMYAKTSERGGFVIRSEDYYDTLWRTFFDAGMLTPLIAQVEGEPVGGVMLFHFGERAWYLHGMSREVHRKKMPPYLLQWEAMRTAKALGCMEYDLWGAPEIFNESDSMWGVYRFKSGLGGQVLRTIGAYDYSSRPFMYSLYTRILPRLLDLMRSRGKKRIHEEHQGH